MNNYILVINSGSSSLKISLFDFSLKEMLISFNFQALNAEDCTLFANFKGKKITEKLPNFDHEKTINFFLNFLIDKKIINSIEQLKYFGHRYVQGGEFFQKSTIIDKDNEEILEQIMDLAPLHNPVNFKTFKIFKKNFPNGLHVAVFDTQFHTTIPIERFLFPIPYSYYSNHKIRKYGFHGSSYMYVLEKAKEYFKKKKLNLIVCHIGAGSSICAIKDSKSFDTSMGMSPLGGIMMGTRCGDIDPSVIEFIHQKTNKNLYEITNELNRKSGIKGVCELETGDFRNLISLVEEGNIQAEITYNMFLNRIIEYIGRYFFALKGEVDAFILTAGIGENSQKLHTDILDYLNNIFKENMELKHQEINGIKVLAKFKNFEYLVIPTNEELVIAKEVKKFI
ncbi:acetate/propionate family kinase [symbiont of Argiope bruennichi]|uniref:acetate/propionate family kinase n=1 Tax=symbiont of Argiope bruennichi TaxID=2810479 RepID=UPI003DA6A7F3